MDREKRVLVVDDDDAIRTMMFTILRRRGFRVDLARDGEEGIEKMGRCRYAVVLLDLMMPVKNGWEVLDWVGTRPAAERPLVIVLTAGVAAREMSPDVVAGSVRKPFDVELLLDMVAACASVHDRSQLENCPPAESVRGRDSTPENVN
jgi:DNA-binding response OmpR family regulator